MQDITQLSEDNDAAEVSQKQQWHIQFCLMLLTEFTLCNLFSISCYYLFILCLFVKSVFMLITVLFCGLLNDAMLRSIRCYMTWKRFERKWSQPIKVLSWHLHGQTKENHEEYQSGELMSQPRMKLNTS
jgi:predicted membrane protein